MLTKCQQKQSKSAQNLSLEVFKKRDLRLAHFLTRHKIDLYGKSLFYRFIAFLPATKMVTLCLLTIKSQDTFSRFSGKAIKPNSIYEYRASS